MKLSGNDVETTITELQEQTKAYLSEIRHLITERSHATSLNIISYFTYSLNISHDPEQESLCLGSYHIHNLGSHPITNPTICIKIPEDSPFSFFGRYVYDHFKPSLKVAGSWERTNDKADQEEFWLKPLGKPSIEPGEAISFSNFQLKWSPTETYAGSITGFTYCDQLKEGTAALNPINLNGTVRVKESEYD